MRNYYDPDIRLIDGGNLRFRDMANGWKFSNLLAPYWRFYRNDKPGAQVTFSERIYPMLPEEGMLIPPNTPFSSDCSNPEIGHFNILFTAAPPYARAQPGIYRFPLRDDFRRLIEQCAAMPTTENSGREVSLLLLRIILTALTEFPEEGLPTTGFDPRVEKAVQRLKRKDADNRELADEAGMCPNAFLRLFRQQTGISPQRYRRRYRIEQACLLLHDSELSIKEVAARTGCCDRYHFSRLFKRQMGISPGEFRRQAMAGHPAYRRFFDMFP